MAVDLKNKEQYVFRYPTRLGVMVIGISIFWFVGPWALASPEKPIHFLGYLMFAGAGCLTLLFGIYCLRYTVRIGDACIEVQKWIALQKYAFSDLRGIEVQSIKGGKVAIASFSDGKVLRLSGTLSNFGSLVDQIKRRQHIVSHYQ